MKKFKKRDVSTSMRPNEVGVVDKVLLTTNSDGYKYTKVKMRSIRIPEVGDKFACFDPSHDVLTSDGWIPITEVTKEHKVASLIDGKYLRYDHPTEIMEYDFDGKMYQVESNQVSLCVTPNHRMWVAPRNGNFRIEKAEDIYGARRKYNKTCEDFIVDENTPREISEGTFRIFGENDEVDFEFPMEHWLTMFGIWIAEGGCYYREDLHTYYVDFASNKERVRKALDEVEAECDGIITISKRKSKDYDTELTNYRICNKKLAKYFNDLNITGSINKDLPSWVWYLNKTECRLLINGMMLGDGHTMANGTRRYDTSSLKLADAFQRLCLHAGYSTNIQLKYAAGKEIYN